MAESNMGMEAAYECDECGAKVYDDGSYTPGYRILNDETPSRRIVCEDCFDALWEAGKISQCEACGEWFDYGLLHDEPIVPICLRRVPPAAVMLLKATQESIVSAKHSPAR